MNATTGTGKGVMIPYIASCYYQNYKVLIITSGTQLHKEMRDRIRKHIGIEPYTIGGTAP